MVTPTSASTEIPMANPLSAYNTASPAMSQSCFMKAFYLVCVDYPPLFTIRNTSTAWDQASAGLSQLSLVPICPSQAQT